MEQLNQKLTPKDKSKERFVYFCEGDCVEQCCRYLADNCIDLIITDPPYGINGDQLHKHYNRDESFVIDGYVEIPQEEYEEFSFTWIKEAERVLRPGGSIYLLSGWTNLRHVLNALDRTDLQQVNHIIWKYNFGVYTRNKYVTSHYHILYLVKPGASPTFNTYSRHSPSKKKNNRSVLYADMEDVWVIDREYKTGKTRHKNELPGRLLAKMIQYSSNEGDVIADFFAGSFSTAKVAKALNRSSVSFEISRAACEHQIPQVKRVQWGEMLDEVPRGEDDRPAKQYQPWTPDELARLLSAYRERRERGMNKRTAIDSLSPEFGRGYFSILNALKKHGL